MEVNRLHSYTTTTHKQIVTNVTNAQELIYHQHHMHMHIAHHTSHTHKYSSTTNCNQERNKKGIIPILHSCSYSEPPTSYFTTLQPGHLSETQSAVEEKKTGNSRIKHINFHRELHTRALTWSFCSEILSLSGWWGYSCC